MAFPYQSVVPRGRSYDEYRVIFGLTDADLEMKIPGFGGKNAVLEIKKK